MICFRLGSICAAQAFHQLFGPYTLHVSAWSRRCPLSAGASRNPKVRSTRSLLRACSRGCPACNSVSSCCLRVQPCRRYWSCLLARRPVGIAQQGRFDAGSTVVVVRSQSVGIVPADRRVGVDGCIAEPVDVVEEPVTDVLGYVVSLRHGQVAVDSEVELGS